MRTSDALQIGKAGEYIVCADLITKGFIAFPSEQGLPYDVVLDTGQKLLRVQVKTCEKPRQLSQRSNFTPAYQFSFKRHGKNGTEHYGSDEVDVFALVALDAKIVGYVKGSEMKTTVNLRVDGLRGSYYDEKGIADYEKVKELHKTIKNQSEISRRLGLNVTIVNRMLKDDYAPFVTSAKYFSDICKDREWFLSL